MGGLYEEQIVKTLATGEVMVFDTRGKVLYMIPKESIRLWESSAKKDVHGAESLAASGNAQKWTREQLATLTEALRQIVLLE
jgi:L-asparaginase II